MKRKVLRRFTAGNPTTLLTLTCNPHQHESRHQAFKDLSRHVNALFKRLRRRFPKQTLEYALIWETTKKGWPHAHLLLRAPFLPQKMVSHLWSELTGAPIVDIRRIPSIGYAAHYVGKYLTKNPQVPPGSKRYRTSRAYSPPEAPTKLRDFLDCGPFALTRFTLTALEAAWNQDGIPTHHWLPWLLVGYLPDPQPP